MIVWNHPVLMPHQPLDATKWWCRTCCTVYTSRVTGYRKSADKNTVSECSTATMHLHIVLLALLCLNCTTTAIALLVINITFTMFGKRMFARMCDNFGDNYNKLSSSLKVELFRELKEMEGGEEGRRIEVLEVGGGSGTNFRSARFGLVW